MKRRTWILFLFLVVPATVGVFALRRVRLDGEADDRGRGAGVRTRRTADAAARDRDRALDEDENAGAILSPGETRRSRPELASQDGDVPAELAPFGAAGTKRGRVARLAWSAGDTWRVETWYLHAERHEKPAWGKKPIVWTFKVRGRETLDGREVWIIDVEPADLSNLPFNPGGAIYIDPDTHGVVAVRDRVQERGVIRERLMRVDGTATGTLFPATLPAPGTETFERTSDLGVLPPDPFIPDPKSEAPKSSGKIYDVEFEADGATIRQRWDAGDPRWPLMSRTPTTVSYLKR